MSLKSITVVLVFTLLLAACSSATLSPAATDNSTLPSTSASSPTQIATPILPGGSSAYPAPAFSTAYPAPGSLPTQPSTSPYPEPGAVDSGTAIIPPSGFEPQATDSKRIRDEVIIDMADSQLLITATVPTRVEAVLSGTMPNPCHVLRVVVHPADANNIINLEAYSIVDPDMNCIMTIEPFNAVIPMGSYSSGQYTVNVNGAQLGQFNAIYTPQASDSKLSRSEATVDMAASYLILPATPEDNVSVTLQGYLPDPCHQLRIAMTPPDNSGKIHLDVYGVYDGSTSCITVIQPFNIVYPLGSFPSGHYSVYVNGELLGKFDS
jgi:hypothetical protein